MRSDFSLKNRTYTLHCTVTDATRSHPRVREASDVQISPQGNHGTVRLCALPVAQESQESLLLPESRSSHGGIGPYISTLESACCCLTFSTLIHL